MHRPRAQVCCLHNSQTCTHRHAAVHHATKSFTSTFTSTNPGQLNLRMGKAEPSACKMLSIWEILRHLDYETRFLFTLQGKLSGFFLQIATELRWLSCTFFIMVHDSYGTHGNYNGCTTHLHIILKSTQAPVTWSTFFVCLFYPMLQTIWKINCISLPSTQENNSWIKTSKMNWKTRRRTWPTWKFVQLKGRNSNIYKNAWLCWHAWVGKDVRHCPGNDNFWQPCWNVNRYKLFKSCLEKLLVHW